MRTLLAVLLAACACGSASAQEKPVAGARLRLQPLSEEIGLKQAVTKWKTDELARQGGKFGDHGWWPWGLRAFDYDLDGDYDLVAVQHGAPKSIVLRNTLRETGKLGFVNANAELGLNPSSALGGCFSPLIWDFDGDGYLDVAYCDVGNTCFFNKAGKTFEPMGFGFGQLEGIRHVADLNGDGYPDVFHDQRRFLYDPKTRKFVKEEHVHPLHATLPASVAAKVEELKKGRYVPRYLVHFDRIDLNGDGVRDLAYRYFGSYGGPMWSCFFLGDGKGNFADATEALGLPADGAATFIRDLNGDGADDVLIVGAGLYLSDGKGKFALQTGPLTTFLKQRVSYIHKAHPVDFANAGHFDLVVDNGRNAAVRIYENDLSTSLKADGKGGFVQVAAQGTWTDAVAACDFDDDGLIDVAIAGPGDSITLYLNR
ncbi:MAG TPA: VCBS repeat-containing protein, partial [Planctomycetota bacterium]|nr:VCBS repeat-containing protein [Planctomycetota bacterium]